MYQIWDLKVNAKTPELPPFAAEGSTNDSSEKGHQHHAGATNNTFVPVGPGSLPAVTRDTGHQEQK